MSSYYVHVIRTDSDIDTGFGPFEDHSRAYNWAMSREERFMQHEWFDSFGFTAQAPVDGVKEVNR
jgi:hypothetical protein